MLPATLVVLALAAAAADTCQPDWVYSFGLKPRWELPRGSCLPTFTTFGEFIRARLPRRLQADPSAAICASIMMPVFPFFALESLHLDEATRETRHAIH